jgi:hypothetical protein
MDISEMPLEITILDGGTLVHNEGSARFEVAGTTFTEGRLTAQIADVFVTGGVTPSGEVARVSAEETEGQRRDIPSTLERLGRGAQPPRPGT